MRYGREIGEALRDALPFSLSILLSFLMVGVLGKQHGLTAGRLFLFSATVMSAPLQLTLLEASPQSMTLYSVLFAAISINLRFFIYSLSLRRYLEGKRWRYAAALAVMGNAAFTLLAAKRSNNLTPAYANTACFTVYVAALGGTMLGYGFANSTAGFDPRGLTVVLAIFIATSLGKQARRKTMMPTQCMALVFCLVSFYWLQRLSLDAVMMATIASSFIYDRS